MPWSKCADRTSQSRCHTEWEKNGKDESQEQNETKTTIIYLEEVIERNIDKLFLNYDIICSHPFRVMRNADLSIDEDEAEDLLKEIEKQLKNASGARQSDWILKRKRINACLTS